MTASALPELWRALHPRPSRPPIDWRSVRVIGALALAAGALVWAGVTLVGVGEVRLGAGMIGVGVVVFVFASQVEW